MTDEALAPPPAPPRRRPAIGTLIALLLILAGIVSALVIYQRRQTMNEGAKALEAKVPQTAADLPVIGDGPIEDFTLTERSGKPVTLKSLLGKVWVGDYFFTYCSGPCNAMSMTMSKLHREFSGKDEPKFVSISSDPGRDTLDVLTEYARVHQADTDRWWFLTGEQKDLAVLARSLMLPYEASKPDRHSIKFVLVDREGRVRGAYDATDGQKLEELRRDLKLLLAAPAKG